MVSNAYTITKKEAIDIFLIMSKARIKLDGKYKTSADKIYHKFEEALNLNPNII